MYFQLRELVGSWEQLWGNVPLNDSLGSDPYKSLDKLPATILVRVLEISPDAKEKSLHQIEYGQQDWHRTAALGTQKGKRQKYSSFNQKRWLITLRNTSDKHQAHTGCPVLETGHSLPGGSIWATFVHRSWASLSNEVFKNSLGRTLEGRENDVFCSWLHFIHMIIYRLLGADVYNT